MGVNGGDDRMRAKPGVSIGTWVRAAMCAVVAACAARAAAAPTAEPGVEDMIRDAMVLERQGDRAGVAELYERIIERDDTKQPVLSRRLVRLYAELGNATQAMEWAEAVVQHHPDPRAYMAGVHAMLGHYDAARSILVEEIMHAKIPRRRLTLRWQLAELYVQFGRPGAAERALEAAVNAAEDEADRAAARRRLETFRRKRAERGVADGNAEGARE